MGRPPAEKTVEQRKLDALILTYEQCRAIAARASTADYPDARKALDLAEHRLALGLLRLTQAYRCGGYVYSASRSTGELHRRPAPGSPCPPPANRRERA